MTAPGRQSTQVVSRARRVDRKSSAVEQGSSPRVVWRPPDGNDVLAAGVTTRLCSTGTDRFDTVRREAVALFDAIDDAGVPEVARPRLFGGAAFHTGHEPQGPWSDFHGAEFVLPTRQLVQTPQSAWLTVTVAGPDATPSDAERRLEDASTVPPANAAKSQLPAVEGRHYSTDRPAWRRTLRSALERIDSGELQKVVLAQALTLETRDAIDPWALLRRLGETHPGSTRFGFRPAPGACFLGATPERLVSLEDRTVETAALAGSIQRGSDDTADDRFAATLQESTKNDREHRIAVETIKSQLADLSASVTTGDRSVRRLPTVQHLETPITATLDTSHHVLSLVDRLHPTATVGGRPSGAALQTIRDLEPFERGWYASPIGWFDAAGNGSFVVAIRSAVVRDRLATLFAGAGIVADSDPEEEWEEVQLKYRPVLDALE